MSGWVLTKSLVLTWIGAMVLTVAGHQPTTAEVIDSGVAGMIFERDVAVPMSDGLTLRANVYRPAKDGRYPVVMLHGPYGKDTHMREAPGFKDMWERLNRLQPDLCRKSSCRFMRWEAPDPERWIPDGYVVVHADSRGAGKTPGFMSPWSPRETQDYAELITWAARQTWSNGRVGLLGVSYYAMNQWNVAALQPEGLAAIIPWEGALDRYRDDSHHGGIPALLFPRVWWEKQMIPVQFGNGLSPYRDALTGERVTGPEIGAAILAGSRESWAETAARHPLDDAFYAERTADQTRIRVPVLSVGNWGGIDVHLRGNIEGYVRIASRQKWLRIVVGDHIEPFYREQSVSLQKRFFDHFLKGADNGWDKEPPIALAVRHPDKVGERQAMDWPLRETQWTRYYLDATTLSLASNRPEGSAIRDYPGLGDGLTFTSQPFTTEAEFTGPVKLKLWVRSSTADMDIFAVVRLLDPAGKDVTFTGSLGQPIAPALGWLRVSHRALDQEKSTEFFPYHSHKSIEPMTPGQLYEVDVEIRPTSVVVPANYRLAVTVQGKDWALPGRTAPDGHPGRDPAIFGGTNAVATGPEHISYLLLPRMAPATTVKAP